MTIDRRLTDPDLIIEFCGELTKLKDIPDRFVRNAMGLGHPPQDCERREQHAAPVTTDEGDELESWPHSPEDCLCAGDQRGVWINDGQNLVCPGCGLDFT